MQVVSKKNIPFMSLVIISLFWAFFYQSSIWINDYASSKSEWLLLIDGFIVLPILCFIFVKNKKEALLKSLAYACVIVLLGSLVIPESSKHLWLYLESGRYVVLAAFVVLEITTIVTVFFAIKASLNNRVDPDVSISKPIEKVIGKSAIAQLLTFEARVWTYFLFSSRIQKDAFLGIKHYTCHNKDGTQSNMLGFILLIAFELPITHLVLHFTWSAFAANLISILTLVGLVFFIAEYKAISIRPVSITDTNIIIRYGVWHPLVIQFSDIETIQRSSGFIKRSSNIRRFNLSGLPNVKIALKSGKYIYLGLDSPDSFISDVKQSR